MGKLQGKVSLITGAGSGIGRAVAVTFAQEGSMVTVADYDAKGGEETVRLIAEQGGDAIFVQADVSKSQDVQHMIEETLVKYERLDILHNNAGVSAPLARIADVWEDDWDHVMDIDLKGAFLGTKHAIPVMIAQGGGVIINTASIMGLNAQAFSSPYCIAKAGVIMLTKSIAVEYTKQNIRANCICPGFIGTAMSRSWIKMIDFQRSPVKETGRVEQIAAAALFLACDDSAYVNGTALVVDGGYTSEWMIPFKK